MKYVVRFLAVVAIIINLFVISTTRLDFLGFRTFRASSSLEELKIKEGNLLLTLKSNSYEVGDKVIIRELNRLYTAKLERIDGYIVTVKASNGEYLANVDDLVGKVALVIDDKLIIVNLVADILIFGLLIYDMFKGKEKEF